MKPLNQIYSELMKERKYVYRHDFLKYCYAYKNGEAKKFTSASEAQQFSTNVEYIYDEERYQEAVEKNNQIEVHAENEIKRLIKERLVLDSEDKLDNALFELAYKIGEEDFNSDCDNDDDICYHHKDYLFALVDKYYKQITNHLPKEQLRLLLKD